MAKKTMADLDMSPLAVAERHHSACQRKVEGIWSDIDKMFDKTGDDLRKGYSMHDLDKKLAEHARAVNELMAACGALVRYQNGYVEPEPVVPEEEVRAIINASLDDKMDELRFTLNRGMVAHHVTQAIRMLTSEVQFDPPLCEDHS